MLQTAYEIVWSATSTDNAVTLGTNGTVEFGFDNSQSPETVQWLDSSGDRGTWWQVVAGGAGFFNDGPVHAPVPEPSVLIGVVGIALVGLPLAWRRRKQAV